MECQGIRSFDVLYCCFTLLQPKGSQGIARLQPIESQLAQKYRFMVTIVETVNTFAALAQLCGSAFSQYGG
jgi:hypothetical protein